MSADAKATIINQTGVRKTLTHLNLTLEPGQSGEISPSAALSFVKRQGWRVHFPPEACLSAGIFFTAPFGVADGYGNLAEDILLALDQAITNVAAQHLFHLTPTGLHERTLELLQRPLSGVAPIGVCLATPGEFHKLSSPYRVGMTMYESTDYRTVHPEWTRQINEMDLMLTFGDWNAEVFERCGVKTPIIPIRGAGNRHFYRPESRWDLLRHDHDEKFTVVTWGMMHKRKSALEMIDAFKRAFPGDKYPDCRFRIKTVAGAIGDLPRGSYRPDDPRIEVISADWLPEQMVAFGQLGDVMLYLSHGEGIGRPPREAMAMGLPLICADNSNMRPICDDRFMTPIETHHWEAAPIGGEWAVPDWDQAVEALRWHYENRREAQAKARAGLDWIRANHSPTAQAQDILAALKNVGPTLSKSVNSRHWARGYVPDTDHTVVVETLKKHVQPPGPVTVFGPSSLQGKLQEAGYRAGGGACIEFQDKGHISLDLLYGALASMPMVVMVVPSDHYPVRLSTQQAFLNFHQWTRLLEGEQNVLGTSTGTTGFNVVSSGTYGGDLGKDFSFFIISAGPRVRGSLVR